MKGPLDRTKVVLRHLPPSITRPMLTDQIDPKFSSRYNWLSFFPSDSSQKRFVHSRAYINFHRAEDVTEFAEFFNGYVFVNEKGAQYKVIVEYAPSQRVPKQWSKKDGREGTIFKDPEYLEFLEFIGRPVQHLPSAEIQLERREAEQAANGKEPLIITPLMDFVRQKRAASSGSRRSLPNGKSIRRTARRSSESPGVISSKRSERRRATKTMYVMRDTTIAASGKNGSADLSKREDQQHSEKAVLPGGSTCEVSFDRTGIADIGKKKIILLKGKEKEISKVKYSFTGGSYKSSPSIETSGRIIKSILQPERLVQSSKVEKDRQPQPSNVRFLSKSRNGVSDDNIPANGIQVAEKSARRVRNKERPDRVVWTPLRRPDGSHAGEESSSSASQSMQTPPFSSQSSEGTPMHVNRSRQTHGGKDAEGTVPEVKSSKRGASSGYNSHEKQVWVQKSTTSF